MVAVSAATGATGDGATGGGATRGGATWGGKGCCGIPVGGVGATIAGIDGCDGTAIDEGEDIHAGVEN